MHLCTYMHIIKLYSIASIVYVHYICAYVHMYVYVYCIIEYKAVVYQRQNECIPFVVVHVYNKLNYIFCTV